MSAWVWIVVAMNAAVIVLHLVLLARNIQDGDDRGQFNLIWIALNSLSIGTLLS